MTDILYTKETISKAVHTKWAGKTVHFAKETDSTNVWIKKLEKDGAEHGTLAVAEFQTAGRGRFTRAWEAEEGTSVMMTLLLRPSFSPEYAPMLTLVMGLSVAQAVQKLGFSPEIKWPNDVVISKKKICGILTEMGLNGSKIRYVGIGTGINVNIPEFPPELSDKATSLFLESGKRTDRNQVVALVMEAFEKNYEIFEKTHDLSFLKKEYEERLANYGQPVRILDKNNPCEGVCKGINNNGELLVRLSDGTETEVSAGEVSVRGLYSYV